MRNQLLNESSSVCFYLVATNFLPADQQKYTFSDVHKPAAVDHLIDSEKISNNWEETTLQKQTTDRHSRNSPWLNCWSLLSITSYIFEMFHLYCKCTDSLRATDSYTTAFTTTHFSTTTNTTTTPQLLLLLLLLICNFYYDYYLEELVTTPLIETQLLITNNQSWPWVYY